MSSCTAAVAEAIDALATAWAGVDDPSLLNGILLCTACHHRVHDEGWEIRIDSPPGAAAGGADDTVWFLPPAHLDPSRAPGLGGRRRFDLLRWKLAA